MRFVDGAGVAPGSSGILIWASFGVLVVVTADPGGCAGQRLDVTGRQAPGVPAIGPATTLRSGDELLRLAGSRSSDERIRAQRRNDRLRIA